MQAQPAVRYPVVQTAVFLKINGVSFQARRDTATKVVSRLESKLGPTVLLAAECFLSHLDVRSLTEACQGAYPLSPAAAAVLEEVS